MGKTKDNLKAAFAGESQATRKYLAFAEKALEEGYPGIARLFRAAAAAEMVHSLKHLRVMKGIGSTKENLEEAISGETHEFTTMYPQMIEEAISEGEKQAEISFRYANEVEKVHAELYKKALADMENFPERDYYVCKICGYTAEDHPPEKCPVCGANQKQFFKVDPNFGSLY
ncbi:MAG: rubrerythrin family protein [Syntrophobacterales bacterium]|nr:rubrerythrin family protein [Syntrophobacterales bacterium]